MKILIVDDESIVREGLKNNINWQELNLTVVGCESNGKNAFEVFNRENPDIILTDIRMPFMDGLLLTKEVKKIDHSVIVILLSAYDDFKYAQQAIRLGAFDYILKPIDIDVLKQTIRQGVLKRKELLDKEKKPVPPLKEEDLKFLLDISLNSIAERLYITPSYLSALFKNEMGITFSDYLTEYRIEKAKELLKDVKIKIYEVAEAVGYTDQHYFSKVFKNITSFTPKEYREKIL